jgi:hypothetical protein
MSKAKSTRVLKLTRCFLTERGDNAVCESIRGHRSGDGRFNSKGDSKMPGIRFRYPVIAVAGLFWAAALAQGGELAGGVKKGTPDLKSAGPLAFAPDGTLFVGDTTGAALFALDTGDHAAATEKGRIEVQDVAGKIAAMLGTDSKQLMINDMAVNPRSGNVYLSVSRGRGPDAIPVLVRINADGKAEEVSLENISFSKAELPNAPGPGSGQRVESITDIAFADGRVFVAGLSNEEFSSRLIAIPYPFSSEGFDGAAIEIYHGSHGRFETKSPIRTFVTYRIANEPYMLAAYTCTPLVKVPVSELKAGAHLRGTTIAELGNRNRPLDMIVYQKDGKDYLLMTNNSRGVMKIPTEDAGAAESIVAPVSGKKGLGYETIASLKGVEQMDQLDLHNAVLLVKSDPDGAMNLRTIELP